MGGGDSSVLSEDCFGSNYSLSSSFSMFLSAVLKEVVCGLFLNYIFLTSIEFQGDIISSFSSSSSIAAMVCSCFGCVNFTGLSLPLKIDKAYLFSFLGDLLLIRCGDLLFFLGEDSSVLNVLICPSTSGISESSTLSLFCNQFIPISDPSLLTSGMFFSIWISSLSLIIDH